MQDPNRFYVYSLIDPSTLQPFYIGKGSNGRTEVHFRRSQANINPHKWNKIQKLLRNGATRNDIVKKLATGLTEDNALELEAFLIEEIGLENLTNIAEGGERAVVIQGEDVSTAKIITQEASWIRWLCQNSEFGYVRLFNHYKDEFESQLTKAIMGNIAVGGDWKHAEPEKPPFWDERWENRVERRYEALCEWKTTDKTTKEVARRYEFGKENLRGTWNSNNFNLKDRFLEEHPDYFKKQGKNRREKVERRYEAIVEWRTTGKTAKEASKGYEFTQQQIRKTWYNDNFGLKARFLEEHPNHLEDQKKAKQEKLDRRYQALCKWRLSGLSSREVAETCEFTKKQIDSSWQQNSFGLRIRFLEEHPEYQP